MTELYHPEDTSTAYFLTHIAESLAAAFEVHVICGFPARAHRSLAAEPVQRRNGVQIERCRSTRFDHLTLPLRALNALSISASIFWRCLRRFRRDDLVLVVTNPPLLPFAVLTATRLRGAPCLLLVHDVYPEVLVASGLLRPGWKVAVLARFSRGLYRGCVRIVVLGRDMQELVRQKLDAGQHKVTVIPNWADIDEIRPRARGQNQLLRQLGLSERFVVQYSGNMGRTHGLETLVEAARLVRDDRSFHFLLIGGGAKRSWLESAAEGLANVTVLPFRPRPELCDSLNACDVTVISFVAGMSGVSVPSRMYNALAAGKPIVAVADAGMEIARLIREEGLGWVVPPGRPEALAAALLEARSQPDRLAQMAARARAVVEDRYTLARVTSLYEDLLSHVSRLGAPVAGGG